MSDFSVRVVRIGEVSNHPDADRLSIIRILGFNCISAKLEDGSHRYKAGDLVVYVPEDAIVPEYLLKHGFWNEKEDKGLLAGSKGDRVKAVKLRGVVSQGILFPVTQSAEYPVINNTILGPSMSMIKVVEGMDVAELLGITKYVPEIPTHLQGQMIACAEAKKFDFDSLQQKPDMFEPGEMVSITEKLHGTCFQFGYVPGMQLLESFGGGDIYVTSKGQGAAGRVFRDCAENDDNLYVRTLMAYLEQGLGESLAGLSILFNAKPIRVFAEIIGQGVQDLSYGLKTPDMRVFDIMVGDDFLTPAGAMQCASALGLKAVPILHEGPLDPAHLTQLRDGRDSMSNNHVREGIVIRAMAGDQHPLHGRKIAKFVSPDYLLRKGMTTEFN